MKKVVSAVLLLLAGASVQCMDSSSPTAGASPKKDTPSKLVSLDHVQLEELNLLQEEFKDYGEMTRKERAAFSARLNKLPGTSQVKELRTAVTQANSARKNKSLQDEAESALEENASAIRDLSASSQDLELGHEEHTKRRAASDVLVTGVETQLGTTEARLEELQRAELARQAQLRQEEAARQEAIKKQREEEVRRAHEAAVQSERDEVAKRDEQERLRLQEEAAREQAAEELRKHESELAEKARLKQEAEAAARFEQERVKAEEKATAFARQQVEEAQRQEEFEKNLEKAANEKLLREASERVENFLNGVTENLNTPDLIRQLSGEGANAYQADRAIIAQLETAQGEESMMAIMQGFERHPAGRFMFGVITREEFNREMAAILSKTRDVQSVAGAGNQSLSGQSRSNVPSSRSNVVEKQVHSRNAGNGGDGNGKKRGSVLRKLIVLGAFAAFGYWGYQKYASRKKAA